MDDPQPITPDPAAAEGAATPSAGSSPDAAAPGAQPQRQVGAPLDPASVEVPDDPASLAGLRSVPTWQPSQYGPLIHSAGAEKLASSAVAPLVASAHDYRTIDLDNLKLITPELGIIDNRSKPAKLVAACVGERDALLMRWHSPASVAQAWRDTPGEFPPTDSVQLRPHPRTTLLNKKNERMKYAVLTGNESVMAIHPATPSSWLVSPGGHLITEGLLKADSALSGLLADAGISQDDLAFTGAAPEEALTRLHQLMEGVPQEKRIVVIALVGVGNWHQNPEWNAFKLKDRPLYLAFDGDVNTNPNVYREAAKVWSMMSNRHADPRLVDLDVTLDDGAGGAVVEKVGIDDFLAKHGSYAELVGRRALDRLPERPTIKDPARKGEWRITDDGCWAEEYVEQRDAFDNVTGLKWEPRVPLGGRIVALETRRAVTVSELETGFIESDSEVNGAEHVVEFEISWRDEGGTTRTGRITGNSDIAGEPPVTWSRRGAAIDPEIALHPEWVPEKREWLHAVKGNRRDQIERRMTWMHMGWVPTEDGMPVFIVGDQVIGPDGLSDAARPGVTERVLDGSSKFGVGIPKDKAEALEAIREVLRVYKGTWTDPRIAAAAISVGLRAAVPHVSSSPVLLSGVRRGGKALPLDASIPVPISPRFPTGWAANADLRLGDAVFAPDGSTTVITAFSEVVDDHDVYEIRFGDGRAVRSTGSHLWKASTTATRNANSEFAAVRRRQRTDRRPGADSRLYGERAARADLLRETAAGIESGVGATASDIARLTGIAIGHVFHILQAMRLPSDQVQVALGEKKPGWAFDAAAAFALLGIDADPVEPWMTARSIADVQAGGHVPKAVARSIRQKLTAAGIERRETLVRPMRVLTVYPVAEALLALADSAGNLRGSAPLESMLTTEQIAAELDRNPEAGFGVRVQGALDLPDADLPVPGYVLGAWLGDGTEREAGFTNEDGQILDEIRAHGYVITTNPTRPVAHCIRGLIGGLRAAGVEGRKHIPAPYLRASADQRMTLLQGLMDTDGSIAADGGCELALTNEALSRDCLDLVRSLGFRASMSSGPAAITEADPGRTDGSTRRRVVGTRWRIRFTPDRQVFRLARKAALCHDAASATSRTAWSRIAEVRRVETVPARCLSVAHPTGMFLVEQYVPTHNSWTVATMATFWQARPNLFSNKSLPGAVVDTSAATEQAVSRALLWVVDDLAPTVDPRQAAQQEARLSDLLRAVFNRSAKRRSTMDMQAREVLTPRAVLLVTAENALQISSVMDRVLHIRIPKNSIVTTELHNHMREKTMTASIAAGACVVNEAQRIRADGWSANVKFWEDRYEEAEEEAKEILEETARRLKHAIPGGVERHIQMAADLSLGLVCLESAAHNAGADLAMLEEISGMRDGLFSLIADGFWAQQETTPGHQLLRALRSLLAAGQAHIFAPGLPGAPIPATDSVHGANASIINQQLGWQLTGDPTNPARALGRPIGQLVVHSSGRHVVLFDPQSAFADARRAYPDLIPPGSGQSAAWSSLWDDNIAEALWRRERDQRSKLERVTVRPYDSATGQTLPSAVPVPLEALLGTSTAAAEREADEAEEDRHRSLPD